MKTRATSARRNFLLGATAGAAGAVAAVVTGRQAAPVADTVVTAEPVAKVKGYHVTAHIQKYYETTKI